MEYFLVDNGSLRSESILRLRQIAHDLSMLSGHLVRPFGLMHSHKVDPMKLNGQKARSMQEFLESEEADRLEEIRVIPFFLGPSLAITDWLPENLGKWKVAISRKRRFSIHHPLYREGDRRLAQAMADLFRLAVERRGFGCPRLAMVDHGTPLVEVNAVRESVGASFHRIIHREVENFSTCCMERREGSEYDFNNPLLEVLLEDWKTQGAGEVILSRFFLLPGRHAGPDGDLVEICKPFEDLGLSIEHTENLGEHPAILEILLDRMREEQPLV